jgi:hypothetical protein
MRELGALSSSSSSNGILVAAGRARVVQLVAMSAAFSEVFQDDA